MLGSKLLVVDYKHLNRDILSRHLRRQGYAVDVASTGSEALAKIYNHTFDLVFLDLKLTGSIDGYQVLEQLQQAGILQHLPVIVISSGDDMQAVARCIEMGAEDYLSKPFNPILLKARLSASLEKKRLQDQQQAYLAQLQRAKEAAEEARRAAEAANQAKSTFLANMSHELRSPLNAILGFAQLMTHNQTLDYENQKNLDIIQRSGEHLLTLINQVLDLSKIEAGRITLNKIFFDLYLLLDDLQNMFSLEAKDKHLHLIFEREDDLPQYIHTDEVKLRQVLINLLSNALKFTEMGGVFLRVGIGRQETGLKRQDKVYNDAPSSQTPVWEPEKPLIPIHFAVEDTGAGIAHEEMDKLFEAFAQTETGRQAQEGTGLGLPISRQFVQLMGGDIQVESPHLSPLMGEIEGGPGTIFKFDIQVEVVDVVESQKPKAKSQKRRIVLEFGQPRYRVLIVDDEWTNRQLLIKFLSNVGSPTAGFELREAENGQEAIKIWQEFGPHLIWMDIRMPVMNGYEATKQIKSKAKNLESKIDTIIIAMTASSFEEERAVVMMAGCDDFLRKPFHEADILEMMGKHIGVRYIYEYMENAPSLQPTIVSKKVHLEGLKATMIDLPSGLLVDLVQATELSDMEMIDRRIAEIRHHNTPLADALAKLANNFEYDKMLALIPDIKDKNK